MTDLRAKQAVPDACALVCAVADGNATEVARILDTADMPALAVTLASMVPEDQLIHLPTRSNIARYVRYTAQALDVEYDEIMSRNLGARVTQARSIACSLAHRAGYNYSEIGRHMRLDHSSVMSACKRVDARPHLAVMAEIVQAHIEEAA